MLDSAQIIPVRDVLVSLVPFVTASCSFVTAICAYLGLRAWKKKIKGESEYVLAKETLKSVYKVRNAFSYVRRSLFIPSEFPDDTKDMHGLLKPGCEAQSYQYAYDNRWKVLAKALDELVEKHIEAQVEWGAEYQGVIKDLIGCKIKLYCAICDKIQRYQCGTGCGVPSPKERQEEREILSEMGIGTYDKELEAAIKKFEDWLNPHIKKE